VLYTQESSVDSASADRPISGATCLLLGLTLLGILVVGNAFLLNALLGRFCGAWLAVLLCLETAAIGAALVLWPGLRPTLRWDWLEIVGMVVVSGAFLAHAVHLAPPDLMPVSFSVDCSHQHLLVNYIYTHGGFPEGVDYLYIYDDYPIVPSALAAFLAHLVGALPAQTMYPLAVLLLSFQVMLAYGISSELLPRQPSSHVVALLATLMIFFVYPYSVRVYAERFYSNMIMGDLMVLFALWVVVVRDRLHPVLTISITIGLVFGCLNSYPAWVPFVIAPLLLAVLLDRRMSVAKRWRWASVLFVVTIGLTLIAVVDQWSFITWFAPSRDRRLTPGWQSLGGAFLIFVGLGAWALVRNWRRYAGLAQFVLITAGLITGLYGIALMDRLTLYIPDKTFYFNVFLFIVLVALGFAWIWDWISDRLGQARWVKEWMVCALMVTLGLIVVIAVNVRFPSPPEYPITLDEYRVAYQVSRELPGEELTYLVRNVTTFYWMDGCVLNRTHDLVAQSERWRTNPPSYKGWINDATASRRAVVSDLNALPQDGRWRTVIRSGNSGVIEKVL
jgi:hypothetical protein